MESEGTQIKEDAYYVYVKRMLNTYYWETRNWRQKFLNEKWLNKDKEITIRK
jgi:hypothetical protein